MSRPGTSDEQVAIFFGGESATLYGRLMVVGGGVLIVGAVALFVALLMLPADLRLDPIAMQFVVTGPILGGIALVAWGLTMWRCPTQVDVGPDEIALHSGFGRRVIPWSDVAAIETGERDVVMGTRLKTLRLLDARRRLLVELNSQLEPFEDLVDVVQRRLSDRGTVEVIDTKDRKRRRDAVLLVVLGPLFVALAGFVGWDASREVRQAKSLARDGVETSARILRHYKFNVTPRLEYEFVDEAGATYKRDTIVDSREWERLEKAEAVEVRYIPSDPDYSRLVQGDADDRHDYDPRLMQLVAPLVGMLGLGFLVAGVLMLCGVDVDGWFNRRVGAPTKSKRKR